MPCGCSPSRSILAHALARHLQTLFLDKPTRSLDSVAAFELHKTIAPLSRERMAWSVE